MGEELSDMVTKFSHAYNWTNLVCNTVFIALTVVIFVISVREGTFRHLPNSLKISLIGFFTAYIAFDISTVDMIVTGTDWTTLDDQ